MARAPGGWGVQSLPAGGGGGAVAAASRELLQTVAAVSAVGDGGAQVPTGGWRLPADASGSISSGQW